MAQVKIYALQDFLDGNREAISEAIHTALMSELKLPEHKRFHRFIGLSEQDFVYPSDRSAQYIILEFNIFEGRSVVAKKCLIHAVFNNLQQQLGIDPNDVEITLIESPKQNWGIRGKCADELTLDYKVEL
ncbi:tautomerase family protein [Alginatibacterium sediminis]|uniref:Tautomerase family protein n=1 Tax=Alginatibacterium sediminis TaxID=2164068 RepID=A0A420E800_9ALTE|nr:tautomerase family protein [Alginatibacterium sediminis]RKF15659.1 tautomerase family protein [Alginatibacterium sediminis]